MKKIRQCVGFSRSLKNRKRYHINVGKTVDEIINDVPEVKCTYDSVEFDYENNTITFRDVNGKEMKTNLSRDTITVDGWTIDCHCKTVGNFEPLKSELIAYTGKESKFY